MELRDYFRVLRNRWHLIALCTVLAVATGALYVLHATQVYRSQTQLFVSTSVADTDPSAIFQSGQFSQARVQSYADIVGGPLVAQQVANQINTNLTAKTIENEVSATAPANTVLLDISVTDPSPRRAQAIAAGIGRVFPGIVQEIETTGSSGQSPVKVTVVKPATFSSTPISPKATLDIGLALLVGLTLGLGAAVLREALDNTVKSSEIAQALTGAAVIGAIAFDPDAKKQPLIQAHDLHGTRAESFRQLRTNLQFLDVDSQLRSIVFTSSVPAEGKTTTVCNLAITVAQAGVRVLLIEADLRRPRVGAYLGLDSTVGLTSVLIGAVRSEDAIQTWRPNSLLDILPSGPLPPNPSELLGSRGMSELLTSLENRYDLIMLDAPPLLPVTDAAVIAAETTGAVIVVHHGATRGDQLQHTAESIRSVGARVLGVVMNFTPRRGPEAYYYGNAYRYQEQNEARPPLQPAVGVFSNPPTQPTSATTSRPEAKPASDAGEPQRPARIVATEAPPSSEHSTGVNGLPGASHLPAAPEPTGGSIPSSSSVLEHNGSVLAKGPEETQSTAREVVQSVGPQAVPDTSEDMPPA